MKKKGTKAVTRQYPFKKYKYQVPLCINIHPLGTIYFIILLPIPNYYLGFEGCELLWSKCSHHKNTDPANTKSKIIFYPQILFLKTGFKSGLLQIRVTYL